ncbi:MAG: hypothetical protein IPL07_18890 [Acidimicrobiaceae bacterium]|nr:hypothetical protein [Acidimicrobiaceae bacterium]
MTKVQRDQIEYCLEKSLSLCPPDRVCDLLVEAPRLRPYERILGRYRPTLAGDDEVFTAALRSVDDALWDGRRPLWLLSNEALCRRCEVERAPRYAERVPLADLKYIRFAAPMRLGAGHLSSSCHEIVLWGDEDYKRLAQPFLNAGKRPG